MYQQSSGDPFVGMLFLLFVATIYLYWSFAQFKLAKKLGCHNNAWWSFIPILQALLLCEMGHKPMWWFLLFLVPVVNIVAGAIVWMNIAKGVGHSAIVGILTLIPPITLVTVGILAFSGSSAPSPMPPTHEKPRQPTPVA